MDVSEKEQADFIREKIFFRICTLIAVLAFASIAPWNLKFFLPNFVMIGGVPFVTAIILMLLKARPSLVSGVLIGFCIFVVPFDRWNTDAMGWLFYFYSLPGGVIASILLLLLAKQPTLKKKHFHDVFFIAMALVPIAMYVNFLIVFNGAL